MFQLWNLVLLCSLSAVSNVESALQSEVIIVDSTQSSALLNLKASLGELLQNLLGSDLADVLTIQEDLLLKVNSLAIEDIQATLTTDGIGIDLSFPLAAEITVNLPLIGQVIDFSVSLALQNELLIETNDETTLVVSGCSGDTTTISLSVLGGRVPLINLVLNTVLGVVEGAVSTLLQTLVCPLIQTVTQGLAVSSVETIICNHCLKREEEEERRDVTCCLVPIA